MPRLAPGYGSKPQRVVKKKPPTPGSPRFVGPVKPVVVPRPESGGTRGVETAQRFKRTPQYKKVVKVAKKAGEQYRSPQATLQRRADSMGLVKKGDTYYHVKRRPILPDIWTPIKPEAILRGGKLHAHDIDLKKTEVDAATQAVKSAGLKALEQTSRPLHGGIEAAKGGSFVHGFLHGHKTFSDLGLPAVPATIADIALDPTTYVSFGRSAPAKLAEEQAARAAAKGATEEAARLTTEAKKLPQTKGLQLGMRFHVPGTDVEFHPRTSGKTTAKVAAAGPMVRRRKVSLGTAATKVRETRPVQGTLSRLAPDFKPKGVTEHEHNAAREADLRFRVSQNQADRHGAQVGLSIRAAVPEAEHEKVFAAAERAPKEGAAHVPPFDVEASTKTVARHYRKQGKRVQPKLIARKMERLAAAAPSATTERVRPTTAELGPQLKRVVRQLNRTNRQLDVAEKAGGVRGKASIPFYMSHMRDINVDPEKIDKLTVSAQRRGRRFGAAMQRSIPGTAREINARSAEPLFSTDPGAVQAHRVAASGHRLARAHYIRDVANTGRKLAHVPATLPENHAPFELVTEPGKVPTLKPLLKDDGTIDRAAVQNAINAKRPVYDLNRKIVEPRLHRLATGPNRVDRFNAKWKFLVTQPNPSYHIGNLFGDSVLAYEGDTSAVAFARSAKALKAMQRMEKHARSADAAMGVPHIDKGTVKVGAEDVPVSQLVKEATEDGAIDAGFTGELHQLSGKEGGRIRRMGRYRENFPRFATYISARARGMTREQAAKWTNTHHIDYGDLTDFEQKVRTASLVGIPFYTFSARNTRIQATKYLTRPGKLANLEKVREEAIKSLGMDPADFDRKLREYEQRGMPIPLKWGQQILKLYPRSPIEQGLSNIPGSPAEAARNLINRTGPAKLIAEIATNYSFFFREKIEDVDKHTLLVQAPQWVGQIAAHDPSGALRKVLGLRKDAKGKYMWPGKVDYIAKSLPETQFLLGATTTAGPGRTGRSAGQIALGYAGVKVTPYDQKKVAVDQLYGRLDELNATKSRLQSLHMDRNAAGTAYTPRYRAVLDEINKINKTIQAQPGYKGRKPIRKVNPLAAKLGLSGAQDEEALRKKLGLPDQSSRDELRKKLGLSAP